jgi:apolipoprotein N-acyltransferase
MSTAARSMRLAAFAAGTPASSRWWRATWPLVAAVSSGLAVALMFQLDIGSLAWVALVPLARACMHATAWHALAIGGTSGLIAALGTYAWFLEVPAVTALHAGLLATYLALFPALWCAALPRLARSRVPFALGAAAWWVLLEALRSHAGFLALPWATLAHSQHSNIALLQLAKLTGEAGVSAVLVAANAAIASLWSRGARATRGALATAAMIVALHAVGAWAAALPAFAPMLRVAAVQPAIQLGERETSAGREAIWQRLEALTLAAAATRPALIAWPETAVADPRSDGLLAMRLQSLAARSGTALVIGAAESDKFVRSAEEAASPTLHNAAYRVMPDGLVLEAYRKRRLVPFAEVMPLQSWLRWPAWLVPAITPLEAGPAHAPPFIVDGVAVGTLICWESLFADLSRGWIDAGARLMVQMTNDVWFGRSAAAWQHNRASVLRAVETGTPVVIASNTGPSQIIDGDGRVVAQAPALFDAATIAADVPLRATTTLYTSAGDWLMASAAVLFALAWLRARSALDWRRPR